VRLPIELTDSSAVPDILCRGDILPKGLAVTLSAALPVAAELIESVAVADPTAVTLPAALPEFIGVLEILPTELALLIGVALPAALPDPIEVAVPRGLSLTNAVSDGAVVTDTLPDPDTEVLGTAVADRLAAPLMDAAIDPDMDELAVTDGAGS